MYCRIALLYNSVEFLSRFLLILALLCSLSVVIANIISLETNSFLIQTADLWMQLSFGACVLCGWISRNVSKYQFRANAECGSVLIPLPLTLPFVNSRCANLCALSILTIAGNVEAQARRNGTMHAETSVNVNVSHSASREVSRRSRAELFCVC